MASGGGVAAERSSFVGSRVPDEISKMINSLNCVNVDKTTFRAIVAGIVASMEGQSTDSDVFDKLVTPNVGLSNEVMLTIAAGLYRLIQLAVRYSEISLKPEMLKEDLLELKFPKEHVSDIVNVVYGSRRASLLKFASESQPHLPSLEAFKWRVDVGISTSVLSRVLEPTVMMEMSLSDGSVHSFEVSISKFHELRYNVACLLKEMEELEKRTILKVQE